MDAKRKGGSTHQPLYPRPFAAACPFYVHVRSTARTTAGYAVEPFYETNVLFLLHILRNIAVCIEVCE
jgi:hypothetical protein